MWTYDHRSERWRHGLRGTMVTRDVIEHYPRETVQRIAVEMADEPLPDEAWPKPKVPPIAFARMILAAAEVRRQLAEVDDVRELYPENRGGL